MIELPEAAVLAKQVNETVTGKRFKKVVAAQSPHKFAWYYGDPEKIQVCSQEKLPMMLKTMAAWLK